MAGKEESNQNLEKSMEDIAGKQESSLKLCPAEGIKLLPSGSLSMEAVTGGEDCSLRMRPTKRKAPTAGHLRGGAVKRKGEDYCSDADIATLDAVFCEDVDKGADAAVLADVTLDEIEEQAIHDTKVAAATQKGASGTGFSELSKYGDPKVESHKTMDEEDAEKASVEYKATRADGTVEVDSEVELVSNGTDDSEYYDDSEAEYQVVVDKANAKFNRFIKRLRARTETLVFKDYTEADFVDSGDEEVCA